MWYSLTSIISLALLVLRPKLVLLLTDVLQSYLSASLSTSASASSSQETRCLLYFRDTESHVVRATIQQYLKIEIIASCANLIWAFYSLCWVVCVMYNPHRYIYIYMHIYPLSAQRDRDEDLLGAMNERDRWREKVTEIRASSATWWWWWWHTHTHIYIYIYIYIYTQAKQYNCCSTRLALALNWLICH